MPRPENVEAAAEAATTEQAAPAASKHRHATKVAPVATTRERASGEATLRPTAPVKPKKAPAGSIVETMGLEDPEPIEIVSELDAKLQKDAQELEAFMNERVMVMVHKTNEAGHIKIVPVTVNGKTQAFLRGQKQRVKRYYVEALARAIWSGYTQTVSQVDPSDYTMEASDTHSYQFSVIGDSARGDEWLAAILEGRA